MIKERRYDEILSKINAMILGSGLGAGVALPSDRELAGLLGTSRVTVRQALGVLEQWGVLEARRGSGTRIRPREGWSLAALPALLAAAAPGGPEAAALRPLAIEALALRRSFARALPAQLAGRLASGSLVRARRLSERAFAARAAAALFVALDAEALRVALEVADAPAAAWLWNDLGRAPRALATWLTAAAPVAEDYLARRDELSDALEAGAAARAERLIGAHLARLDRGLLAAFEPRERGQEAR
jgi:DNA-binding FadR family transcriptional regulator